MRCSAGAGRQEKHVSHAQQVFGAVGVDDGARIGFGGDLEGEAGGEIGLDDAGEHIHRGPLGGQNQVNAGGPRHLRQAGEGHLHIPGGHHHQVGQFVDDDDDVGQRAGRLFTLLRRSARPLSAARSSF
jgi:hypothetical protein